MVKVDIEKITTSCVILLILLLSFTFFTAGAQNNSSSGTPDWKEGYSWKYISSRADKNESSYLFMNVTDKGVKVGGYDCYEVQVSVGNSIVSYRYLKEENLAMVQLVYILNETIDTDDEYVTYEPPVRNYDFPLQTGKSWGMTVTKKTNYREQNFTLNYECKGERTINTEAGEFETLVIKRNKTKEKTITPSETSKRITYYSPEAKNMVRLEYLEIDNETGETKVAGKIELVDYDITVEEDSSFIPSYNIVTGVIVFVAAAVFIEFKKE